MQKRLLKFAKEQKTLKRLWLLISAIILACWLAYNWNNNLYQWSNYLQDVAEETQDEVEKLFNQFLRIVFSLPVYGKHFTNCEKELLPLLKKAVSEHPVLAGLTLEDNHNQTLCSTLPKSIAITADKQVFGSLLQKDNMRLFFLRKQLGDYHFSIFFPEKLLKNLLQSHVPDNENDRVFLFDKYSQKTLIASSPDLTPTIDDLDKLPYGISPLNMVDSLYIIAVSTEQDILKKQLLSAGLTTLLFSLFSFLLYWLISKIMDRHYSLQGHLWHGLKNDEFFPLFQPIFDVKNNRFAGAEVLLRWKTSENDIVTPDAFIEEAEKNALIVPLTLKIANIAMEHYKTIIQPTKSFYLAFNVSAYHFTSPSFFTDFIKLTKKHHIKPEEILFEITERDLINKNDKIYQEKMQLLRKLHFSLAIDDFGTGHANISYLQHFPFNYLKIDKLFVQSIGTGSITESLIDTIINMGKALKLTIIAEGVEEKKQADYLLENQVPYLQGWYYAKVMTADELHRLIKDN